MAEVSEEIKNVVRGGYRKILLREADPGGLENYANELASGRINTEKFLELLKNSDEYKARFGNIAEISEEIKNNVRGGYRKILLREPDPGGFEHYTNDIASGRITYEKFLELLRTSDEYKARFGNAFPQSPQISENLTYCMIGGNKLHEIKDYIPEALSYVDRFLYIDSGSTDGTLEFLRDLSKNNKITIVLREWQDKFSYFRNFYMEQLKNENYDGWILTSDTDEHYPTETLSQLRNLIKESNNGINYNGIQFRSYDMMTDYNDITKIVDESLSNYWKPLMFKFHPNLHYEGEPHETLVGENINWKQTDLIYRHYRSQKKIYLRAVENFWISNSNRYSQKWSEFRILNSKNNLLKFKDFIELYNKGTLPEEIENWIYDHRNDNENEGDSETREMAKLYFDILHSDKKIKK